MTTFKCDNIGNCKSRQYHPVLSVSVFRGRENKKKIRESLLDEPSMEVQNSPEQSEADKILDRITVEAALNGLPIGVFCCAEQERLLNYWEFLWAQLKLIRKRWWLFQLILLFALWTSLSSLQGEYRTQRFMGVAASLFIILIIQEFWKSQTYQSYVSGCYAADILLAKRLP